MRPPPRRLRQAVHQNRLVLLQDAWPHSSQIEAGIVS